MGDGKEELEQYLLEWVYEYGSPFTEIRYVFDSYNPLEVVENTASRELYEQAYPYHDEPLCDANGRVVGIKTVLRREKTREEKPLTDKIKDSCLEQIQKCQEKIAELENTIKLFEEREDNQNE